MNGIKKSCAVFCFVSIAAGLVAPVRAQLLTVVVAKGQILQEALVTLSPKRVSPKAISIPSGPFALRIENRSRIFDIVLVMTKDKLIGELLRSTHSRTNPDNGFILNLEPGVYTFATLGDGPWTFTITVAK